MARPKPSAPSPRVYAAFAIAAIIGAAVFAVWWLTSDARLRQSTATAEKAGTKKPAVEEIIDSRLPRGGSLTGSTDDIALAVERLTGAPLVRVNRSTDQVEPWLAESWTASPDNLIYTVTLRPGLVTSDGVNFNAPDAAKALSRVTAFDTPVAVRAINPRTLEIRFAAPFAPALRVFDQYPIAGLGPFVEEGARAREYRTFERNTRYWRKAADGSPLPYLDEIVLAPGRPGMRAFADTAIEATEFEALKKAEQSGHARLFDVGPALEAEALWFSATPPRADERPWLTSDVFRRAISTAVDRREYCKQVFYGACDPMAGPVSPANVAWFNPDFPLGQGNPQLARTMLAELGLRDRTGDGLLDDATRRPVRFSLLIPSSVPSSARAATFLAATLKAIGVQMDITQVDIAARRKKGNYDAIYDRIEMRDTDPAMNLDFWLSSGEAHVWNPRQGRRVADWERQIDDLMMKNATTFDRIERLQAFVDAQKIYLQHLPAIFFGAPHVRIWTSMPVLNATPSPLRPHLLWNAENLAALK